VASDRTQRNLRRAAALIAKADALLITAGAGMSVDSGLPDFRGGQGFWRAYPPLKKLGISFEEMAQPHWFDEKPGMAWAFYGHRQQLYRETNPHMGYWMLRDWARAMPAGHFVVTSNVDGAFEAAGFSAEQILEQHGNIDRYQCTVPCSSAIWTDDASDLQIDLATLQARGPLPRCPECGALARPNVLMFGDFAWVADAMEAQRRRYQQWLASVRGKQLVIIELGAGTALATIRWFGEKLTGERTRTTLVRINPDASVVRVRSPVSLRFSPSDACFRRQARPRSDPGKASEWSVAVRGVSAPCHGSIVQSRADHSIQERTGGGEASRTGAIADVSAIAYETEARAEGIAAATGVARPGSGGASREGFESL